MQYVTSLAPAALTATAISIMSTIIWVIGQAVRKKTLYQPSTIFSAWTCLWGLEIEKTNSASNSMYTPCPPPGWLLIVRAVAQHVWHAWHVPPRQLCSYGHHPWLSSSLLCCSETVGLDWFIQYDWAFCRELEVKNSNEARTNEVNKDMKPEDLLSTEWINSTDMPTIVKYKDNEYMLIFYPFFWANVS